MGGGGSYDGGGAAPDPLDCRKVNKWTGLANPQRDVLENISEGDVLRVRVREGTVAVVADGRIVGIVSEMWTDELRRCIEEKQYSYEAEVVRLDGAVCRVNITNRRE